uniref:Uncharacterized protein n=1 Tax=viral metagenome TaxID=1070528 RepID=A0A6C0I3J3_9ZZZZ
MDYYVINGVKYAAAIPKEWSINHLPGTGPHECTLCVKYGFSITENIWQGYCWRCAGSDTLNDEKENAQLNHYQGSRGPGYISQGVLYHGEKEKDMKTYVEELTDEDWAAINLAYEMRDNITEMTYEYGSECNGGYDSH